MTRIELVGEVYGYLANADSVPLPLIYSAIDDGVLSVYRRTMASRYWKATREKFVPLVADQDEVDLGPDVESVVNVFRQDQGGARCFGQDPAREEDLAAIGEVMPTFTYLPLPNGRLRLLQIPTVSSASPAQDGLRLVFRPRPVRLLADAQEPDLPQPAQEAVVVEAVARLILKGQAAAANAQQFEGFRRRVAEELGNYISSSHEDGPTYPADTWGFYDDE